MTYFSDEDRNRLIHIEVLLQESVVPKVEAHEKTLQQISRERWMVRGALIAVVAVLSGTLDAVLNIFNL